MGPVVTRSFDISLNSSVDRQSASAEIKLLVRLATALQHYGAPAHRLERACGAVANKVGLEANFFSTPTAVFASFGNLDIQNTYLLRSDSGDVHLEKLSQIDHMIEELMVDRYDSETAFHYLEELTQAPERYGPVLTTLSFSVASATASRFLGGGWPEIVVAGFIGLLIGLLALIGAKNAGLANVLMPISAIIASSIAAVSAAFYPGFIAYTATIAGLIVLVPGLSFTTAMVELSTGHLASGTARLAKATSMFLLIAFGIALGSQVNRFLPAASEISLSQLPKWSEWLALLVAPPAFAVLFRARPKDFIWIMIAGPLAFYSARLGGKILGPELGSFIASFILGVVSNLFARLLRMPSAIMMEPGIIFLVPGTIGLRSLGALLANDPISGVETAFSMILIAIALVIGLLFAHVVVPPRRSL